MGNRSSLLLREEEIEQIQEETGCMSSKIRFYVLVEIINVNNFFFQLHQIKLNVCTPVSHR